MFLASRRVMDAYNAMREKNTNINLAIRWLVFSRRRFSTSSRGDTRAAAALRWRRRSRSSSIRSSLTRTCRSARSGAWVWGWRRWTCSSAWNNRRGASGRFRQWVLARRHPGRFADWPRWDRRGDRHFGGIRLAGPRRGTWPASLRDRNIDQSADASAVTADKTGELDSRQAAPTPQSETRAAHQDREHHRRGRDWLRLLGTQPDPQFCRVPEHARRGGLRSRFRAGSNGSNRSAPAHGSPAITTRSWRDPTSRPWQSPRRSARTPLAMAALEAGKHVLLEKPLAGSVREAELLVRRRPRHAAF